MPALTISKTISAAHLARALPALKAHFGLPATATNVQVMAEWEKMVLAQLKGIVRTYEASEASKTATDGVTEIELT